VNNKVLYSVIGVWFAIRCFAPTLHHAPTTQVGILAIVQELLHYRVYVAMLLLLLLIAHDAKPDWKIWKLLSVRLWNKIGWFGLSLTFVGFIWNTFVAPITLVWDSLLSFGIAILVAMVLWNKMHNRAAAVLVGLMGSFAFTGVWEIPYYVLTSTHFNAINLMKWIIVTTPFFIVCVMYKIVPTKLTLVLVGIEVAMWLVWIFPGDFVTYISTYRANEPVNWPIYQMVKSSKAVLALAFMSLVQRGTYEKVLNN